MYKVFCISLLLLCQLFGSFANLSQELKQKALDEHNYYRSLIAMGLYEGQPSAAKMPPLQWHDGLAINAAKWAASCSATTPHDTNADRIAGTNFGNVGQNYMPCYKNTGAAACIHIGVHAWAVEAKHFNPTTGQCTAVCGHLTALAWDRTMYVGCAFHQCNDIERFVCDYGLGGNTGGLPYEHGPPCSKCENDRPVCVNGLCLTAAEAAKSANASQAVCKVNSQCAANGGTPETQGGQCRCKCNSASKVGENCEVSCHDNNPQCGSLSDALCQNPVYEHTFTQMCAKRCSLCMLRKRTVDEHITINMKN
nr:eukaryotic cystein-rich sectretory domain-containing protein [Theama mediterranea]